MSHSPPNQPPAARPYHLDPYAGNATAPPSGADWFTTLFTRVLLFGAPLLVVLVVVGGVYWSMNLSGGVRIINPANRRVRIFLDGQPLSPSETGHAGYADVSFAAGKRHLQVEIDGDMAIDQTLVFKSGFDYFVFAGGDVLIDRKLDYGTSSYRRRQDEYTHAQDTYGVYVDGAYRTFAIQDQLDDEFFYSVLFADPRIYTQPALLTILDDYQTTMPYEAPPEEVYSRSAGEYVIRHDLAFASPAGVDYLERKLGPFAPPKPGAEAAP